MLAQLRAFQLDSTCPAVAHIPQWPSPSFDYESQLAQDLCLFNQKILETSRLILRPFREEDIGRLAELMANRDFTRFSLGPYTCDQTKAVLQKFLYWNKAGLPSPFAVVLRENDDVIGYCGFLHHSEMPEEVEIGYRLDSAYWNRGLITEAARAVRDHAFGDLKLPRVISLIHPENIPSRRVAEKIGMAPEKQITFRGFPTNLFSLSRDRWLVMSGA